MRHFTSYDGTDLAYRVLGTGEPLICLSGGPARGSEYLGDLGGLDATRQLIQMDIRGVGDSATPSDPTTQRVASLVRDVEELRRHLGLHAFDVLAHSAGAVLASLYAVEHPDRLSRLALITPGLAALGIAHDDDDTFLAALTARADEPWYPEAFAAMERMVAGEQSPEVIADSRPFFYARWDARSQAHASVGLDAKHQAARERHFEEFNVDEDAVLQRLGALDCAVLVYGGGLDPLVTERMVSETASRFDNVDVFVDEDAGHYPWIDNPGTFNERLTAFLDRPAR